MPNPYPTELRARAVRAYEAGDETCEHVAARFEVGVATLERWLQRQRRDGTLDPLAKAGGWRSPVDGDLLRRVIAERPDRTTEELTREYNRQAAPPARVHRSSILRALQRFGYVFKKNARDRRNSIVRGSKPNVLPSRRGPPP
jgi:transposase